MAAANASTLVAVRDTFEAMFLESFQSTMPWWEKLAMRAPSSGAQNVYQFLNDIPQLREWLGERQLQQLTGFDYTLKNKVWESSISIKVEDIERDALGMYNARIRDLGMQARKHPDRLIADLITTGFTTGLAFDGLAFFHDAHVLGAQTNDNLVAGALSTTTYNTAKQLLGKMKGVNGEPIVSTGSHLLVCGPQNEETARQILNADFLPNAAGTAPQSNIWKGSADLLIVQELGAATHWMLADNGRGIKPFIYQEEKAPQYVGVVNPDDSHVFLKREVLHGADYRGNAGYGPYFMAVGSTG